MQGESTGVTMSEWTEEERSTLREMWGKLDVNDIGHQAVTRFLLVYPWAQRYFPTFGNLSTKEDVLQNPNVAKHGETVMKGLANALQNLENIKLSYSKLKEMHCDEFNIDPENFRLFASCLTVCVASTFGRDFSIPRQDAWQKFLAEVVAALGGKLR
ncbi:hemoglobin subunit beta-A-like [Gouania willdenowi]|uniref:Hemoglobin subunit beta-A-like n=1 Tax=Gouania willdenowi TaxID=441366 RepID=A0A8C5EFI0_GOUWI|nr:hemoglobin subunit beta-A-like [Gouania willdenowi]